MSALKSIYAGVKAVGIQDEEDRRDLFERVTGKRSLRAMSSAEQESIVVELRRLGYRHASPARRLDGPYAKKLQALWIAGWNLGLVRNRDDAALMAFVKRQTGLDHSRWLRDPADAKRAIEALKDWVGRDGGVMWGNTNGYDWLKDHGAKVAWAQWAKIHPGASLRDQDAFRDQVMSLVGSRPSLDVLTSADWRIVSNGLGQIIRRGA